MPPGSTGESVASQSVVAPRPARATLELWSPQSEADKSAVKAQLDLLLAHPLFFQSKRYPALLRFVVEQTIEGNADQVKERSIGMEVFGPVAWIRCQRRSGGSGDRGRDPQAPGAVLLRPGAWGRASH